MACAILAAYDPFRYGVIMGIVQRVADNTTQLEGQQPFMKSSLKYPQRARPNQLSRQILRLACH